jgi:hypothetical protein
MRCPHCAPALSERDYELRRLVLACEALALMAAPRHSGAHKAACKAARAASAAQS